jgi:hypothetical protein
VVISRSSAATGRPRPDMKAARRARNPGSPSVVEYCSARTASGPASTSSNAARRPGTSNVSGAGRPPASEMISGRIAICSSSRTGEDWVAARRSDKGAPVCGAGGEMAMAWSSGLLSDGDTRRPPGALGRVLRGDGAGYSPHPDQWYGLRQSDVRAYASSGGGSPGPGPCVPGLSSCSRSSSAL